MMTLYKQDGVNDLFTDEQDKNLYFHFKEKGVAEYYNFI